MSQSNLSYHVNDSLPTTPDPSRPTSSLSQYSNSSSIPHNGLYNTLYDHRHSFISYNTHVQQRPNSHRPFHGNQLEVLDHDPQQDPTSPHDPNPSTDLSHKASISTIGSNFTQKLHEQQQQHLNLRKQVTTKGISQRKLRQQQQQQQQQQKHPHSRAPVAKQKTLPLFPTVRTRGSSSVQDALRPVDVNEIDLMPIEFSHKIIMRCIDEIRYRGLKHKHLFRNAYYSPSVEAALSKMISSKQNYSFSIKMMRMDTVGGLLTTCLSRTYPPLVPPHIRELFENPKGRFFFELLSLLPELNRFLFVEILDLCCDLVDNQAYNHVSHSKVAIYPGSCCFGLDEYMPTWDTRYLMTPDLKKFSKAFYQVIYAYREERDLSAEQLQLKLDARERQLEQERFAALELEHGLVGASEILRMESRLALGLPAESPLLPPSDTKEISLYADRKEVVVADDAISVFDMQLDDNDDTVASSTVKAKAPRKTAELEEESIELVRRDLRRSISVANLEKTITTNLKKRTATMPALSLFSTPKVRPPSTTYPYVTRTYTRPSLAQSATTARTKSMARFTSIHKFVYPVSPGDIFGISRNAIEKRELQNFMAVARTVKKRKPVSSKKLVQLRVQNRLLRQSSRSSNNSNSSSYNCKDNDVNYRGTTCATTIVLRRRNSGSSTGRGPRSLVANPLAALPNHRRSRNRQLRKELQAYLDKGLTPEEAAQERELDLKKEKRRAKKKAKRAAKAAAEREAAAAAAITHTNAGTKKTMTATLDTSKDVTIEEAEVLEAFDYLSDQEFSEFIALAGLTMADVDRIREKSAAAVLTQVTQDIHQSGFLNSGYAITATNKVSEIANKRNSINANKRLSLNASKRNSLNASKRVSIDAKKRNSLLDSISNTSNSSHDNVSNSNSNSEVKVKTLTATTTKPQETTPKAQQTIPKVQQTTPKAQTTPLVQKTSSKVPQTVPKVQQTTSKVPQPVPKVQQTVPKVQQTTSKLQQTVPKVQQTVPMMQQNAPSTPSRVPVPIRASTSSRVAMMVAAAEQKSAQLTATKSNVGQSNGPTSVAAAAGKRPFNLPHMTSMDLLIKNATVIGDSNLRCYPTSPPMAPRTELFTANVITEEHLEKDEEDSSTDSTALESEETLDELEVLESDDDEGITSSSSLSSSSSFAATTTDVTPTAVQSSESLVMPSVNNKSNHNSNGIKHPPMLISATSKQALFEFETIVYAADEETGMGQDNNEDEDEEAAELRELLAAMSEEERSEFLRLSSNSPSTVLSTPTISIA
ncbi:hypothetical protein BGZ94_009210 [Podila epigama]|nr:hypothetical protein BGZ94_009210 [Podila epigama]